MGAVATLQDWITVQGASEDDFTIQSPDDWLDVTAWSDVVLYVEYSEIVNAVLVVQTSPITDESLWKTLKDSSGDDAQWTLTVQPDNPFIARFADAQVPLSTLVRWAAAAESSAAWKITFRIRAVLKTD